MCPSTGRHAVQLLRNTQDKRLIRLANKAQTLAEAYRQSTLVVPIAMPQRPLPRDISLDLSSPWHTSALLATALETATLPSRLRNVANRDSLGTMSELLNSMGKQSIASLHMSIHASEPRQNAHDTQNPALVHEDSTPERVQLDIDFSPPDELASGRDRGNGYKKPQLFGQLLTDRGHDTNLASQGPVDMEELINRRHAQQPVTRR